MTLTEKHERNASEALDRLYEVIAGKLDVSKVNKFKVNVWRDAVTANHKHLSASNNNRQLGWSIAKAVETDKDALKRIAKEQFSDLVKIK